MKNHLLVVCGLFVLYTLQTHAKYSISGISSGGFMASQMGVIYSNEVTGVGVIAAGFYNCAGDHFQQRLKKAQSLGLGNAIFYSTDFDPSVLWTGQYSKAFQLSENNPVYQAVAICMHAPEKADIKFDELKKREQMGLIAPLQNISRQRVFLYQGTKDSVVHKEMLSRNLEFYSQMKVPQKNLKATSLEGGHNFPTDKKGLATCDAQSVPYIASCNYDLAGDLLKSLLGVNSLIRSNDNEVHIMKVSQAIQGQHPASVADYAYLAASAFCLNSPGQCQLHVALHGCEMSDSFDEEFDKSFQAAAQFGYLQVLHKSERLPWMTVIPVIEDREPKMGTKQFAELSGYARYANDKNKLMVLFPQTWIGTENYPGNPKGCWDWYGSTGSTYSTNKGSETSWLNRYVKAVGQDPQSFIIK